MFSKGKSLILLLSFSMIFSFVVPMSAFAEKTSSELNSIEQINDPILNEAMKYVYIDGSGNPFFDVEEARKDGQSVDIIEQGKSFNNFSEKYSRPDGEITVNGIPMPIWGNWCGPNYGSGDTKDYLDAACKQHDLDYKKYGYFDCGSDIRLIARITRDYDKMKFLEKAMARNVIMYFTAQAKINGCY